MEASARSGTARLRPTGPFWIIAGLVAAFVLVRVLPAETARPWMRESGPVENLSASGYLLCALVVVWRCRRQLPAHWYFPVVLIAAALRELDFHVRFTTTNIMRRWFYQSPAVPTLEKAIVVGLVATVAVAVTLIVWRHGRAFIRGFKEGSQAAICIAWAAVFAVVSLSIDNLPRKLARRGVETSDSFFWFIHDTEELLEVGIPLMLMVAATRHVSAAKTKGPTAGPDCV